MKDFKSKNKKAYEEWNSRLNYFFYFQENIKKFQEEIVRKTKHKFKYENIFIKQNFKLELYKFKKTKRYKIV